MASPAELRAKLLAKRASQQEETRRKEQIHESAKIATKNMVMLGYNFDDILELLKSEVSEAYLIDMFRSIGFIRKRKSTHKHPLTAFGAARWLDHEDNFVIRLDEALSSDEDSALSDAEGDEKAAPSPKTEAEAATHMSSTEVPASGTGNREESATVNNTCEQRGENTFANAEKVSDSEESLLEVQTRASVHEPSINETELASSAMEVVPEPGTAERQSDNVVETPGIVNINETALEPISGNFAHPAASQDIEMTDAAEPAGLPGTSTTDLSISRWQDDTPMNSEEPRVAQGEAQEALERAEEAQLVQEVPAAQGEAQGESPESPRMDAQREPPVETQREVSGEAQDGELEAPRVPVPDEEAVQRELDKVQAQIRQVQELKLAREAQREAIADMNRRNMELRDIASKRALLIQKRDTIDVSKAARRVDELERKLEAARKYMFHARHQLAEVDRETEQLEKQELKLREELSRPRPVVAPASAAPAPEQAPHPAAKPEPEAPKFQYPVPTAAQSPLRAFNSFRMCPSLGISHWFSKSFNGGFVRDLTAREMCPDEIRGKSHKTSRADCEYVHFSDFDIAPLEVCQYMGSRQVDRPGYREGLVQALKTHLPAETSPEYIAASIIGFSRKYDASQILDWQGWGVERPL